MPIPSTEDKITQNGRDRNAQNISQVQEFIKPNNTLPSPEPVESVNDDWSSLTQDFIDTLPQVWTRGLLYVMVLFTCIILPWAILAKVGLNDAF